MGYLSSTTYLTFQVLAAHRYGIKRVILPERNLKDLVEIPSAILSGMEVIIFYFPLIVTLWNISLFAMKFIGMKHKWVFNAHMISIAPSFGERTMHADVRI